MQIDVKKYNVQVQSHEAVISRSCKHDHFFIIYMQKFVADSGSFCVALTTRKQCCNLASVNSIPA